MHEEQDDVNQSLVSGDETRSEFKFLEKSALLTTTTSKKSNLLSSLAKSLTSSKSDNQQTLTKLLTDILAQVGNNNQQIKLLTEWALDYSQRLLKLKHKIDEQKQNDASTPMTSEMSTTQTVAASSEDASQKEKRKNQIAEKSRAKVMAKLNKMQKNFMENYKELYEETKSLSSSVPDNTQMSAMFATGSNLTSDVDMMYLNLRHFKKK